MSNIYLDSSMGGSRRSPAGRCTRIPAMVIPIAMLLLPACGADIEADTTAIRMLIDKEAEAINGESLGALSEIWSQSDDISLVDVPPPGRFIGWDRIARVFRDFFDRVSEVELRVSEVQIRVAGEIAYASYGWSMTGRVGERSLLDRGQATAIYRRQKEGWRLVHAHYSPVPPALALEAEQPPKSGAPDSEGDATPDG